MTQPHTGNHDHIHVSSPDATPGATTNARHLSTTTRTASHLGFTAAVALLGTLAATDVLPAEITAITWVCLCLVSVAWAAFAFRTAPTT